MVVLLGNNQLALAIEWVYIVFMVEEGMVNQLLGHNAHKEDDAQKHTDQSDNWFPQGMVPTVCKCKCIAIGARKMPGIQPGIYKTGHIAFCYSSGACPSSRMVTCITPFFTCQRLSAQMSPSY